MTNEQQQQIYGQTGWIVGDINYADGLDVVKLDKNRTGTIPATFTGTLEDAILNAPELGSTSERLGSALRLHKRTFSAKESTVTATFIYGVFVDEEATYSMSVIPIKVELLKHKRFKKVSDIERVIAQEYLGGGTDATAIYRSRTKIALATSVPKSEESKWVKTTLGALVEENVKSSDLVKLARKGVKSLDSGKINWTETKITRSRPSVEHLDESSTPRGNYPSGYTWILSSINLKTLQPDQWGNPRYETATTWKTDDN